MSIVRIPLNSRKYPGLFALIDESDYDEVAQFPWHPVVSQKPSGLLIYAGRRIARYGKGSGVLMHVQLLAPPKGLQVDHINGDKLDNRRDNLRLATQSQNNRNMRLGRNNSSGFKGVSWAGRERRWRADIRVDGRSINIGYFRVKEEAARAYDRVARECFGEFALTNADLGLYEDGDQ